MATDRMYLECRCGSAFRLARLEGYDVPWTTGSSSDLQVLLEAWFEEHNHCDPDHFPARPRLVYESDGPPSPEVAAYMARVRTGEIQLGDAWSPARAF